jgi:hypothetical protein
MKDLFVVASLLVSVMLIISTPAWAARPAIVISQIDAPTIEVRATDGQTYNAITKTKAFGAQMAGNCEGNDKVFNAYAYIEDWPASKAVYSNIDDTKSELDPTFKIVRIPWNLDVGPYPVWLKERLFNACNEARATTPLPPSQSVEMEVNIGKKLSARLQCSHKGKHITDLEIKVYNGEIPAKVKLVCLPLVAGGLPPPPTPKPKTPSKDIVQEVKITQANLVAFPDNKGDKCEVKLSATLVASGKTTVSYLFENHLRNRSAVQKVDIDQTQTAFFTKVFDFKKSDTGVWFQTPTSDTGSGPTIAAKLTGNTQGFFKMVGVSHAFESNTASYNFKCDEPVPTKKLQPVPAEPKGDKPTRPIGP